MKKLRVRTIVVVGLIAVAAVLPGRVAAAAKGRGRGKFRLPPAAREVGPGVYYLGKAKDKGRDVEGYAIVKYRRGQGKPGTQCGNGICEPGENAKKCPGDCAGGEPPAPDTSDCYEFLGRGARWRTTEPYVVDATNGAALEEGAVLAGLELGVSSWNDAAGVTVLGGLTSASGPVDADADSPDGVNEVLFADIEDAQAIAVTIVWGIFNGPPRARELVEWDQVYDDVDFAWSATGDAGTMDFPSIATHELGHSCGLADLYSDECSEQTMYGYAETGETKKRTLEDGDIEGIRQLYK